MSKNRGYGKTVIKGKIQYLSPSGISTGDPTQYGGCLRRWLYKYVLGYKEPFTGNQKLGVETHSCIEKHLLNLPGQRMDAQDSAPVLNSLAVHASQFIPEPDPSYLIESRIQEVKYHTDGRFKKWAHDPLLTVAGIRVVGEIDLLRPASLWSTYISELGDLEKDPDNTTEVLDWKTCANIKMYAKSGLQLLDTVQMVLYGQYAIKLYNAEYARLSHVYMQTKGAPRSDKRTVLASREDIAKRFERVESSARALIDVAKEDDPSKVPGNLQACDAWRGCPRKDICPRPQIKTLAEVFGIAKSKKIKQIKGKKESKNMDIMDQLGLPNKTSLAPSAPAPKAVQTKVPPRFAEVLEKISKTFTSDKTELIGKPKLEGDEALAWNELKGLPASTPVVGSGKLAALQAMPFVQMYNLAGIDYVPLAPASPVTLEGVLDDGKTISVDILPDNVPVIDKEKAAMPIEGYVVEEKADVPAPVAEATAVIEEPKASEAPLVIASIDYSNEEMKVNSTTLAEFKKLKKPDMVLAFERLLQQATSATESMGDTAAYEKGFADAETEGWFPGVYDKGVAKGQSQAAACAPQGIELNIDCLPSVPFDRLDGYIRDILAKIRESTGAEDIRCSEHKILGFGKWKGAIAAMVNEQPPEPGVYYIDTCSEIYQEFANALRGCAAKYTVGGAR